MLPLFEYYEDMEHFIAKENEPSRERVTYFVIGQLSRTEIIICYVGHLSQIAIISDFTHSCALEKSTITFQDALKAIQKEIHYLNTHRMNTPKIHYDMSRIHVYCPFFSIDAQQFCSAYYQRKIQINKIRDAFVEFLKVKCIAV